MSPAARKRRDGSPMVSSGSPVREGGEEARSFRVDLTGLWTHVSVPNRFRAERE
jgi:hypothetical protein